MEQLELIEGSNYLICDNPQSTNVNQIKVNRVSKTCYDIEYITNSTSRSGPNWILKKKFHENCKILEIL